ncbi:hypothetical protein AAON49_07115 [Pseudotenacibaculum sp. MALMAid0570]|uniref:hypothetical protein n=1 Tax=Pseudotenacibaculum sp. MALMAid0570 TaxID=3143938 RepID=UPI0032DE3276
MENNLDREIREKLQGREIQPSASAWERLSAKLDVVEQKKKKSWFLYVGYAASILLIVSLFFFLQEKNNKESIPENKLVEEQVKEPIIDKSKEFTTTPSENNVIVENKVQVVKKREEKLIQKKSIPSFREVQTETTIAKKVDAIETKETKKIDVQQKIKELNKEETHITQTNPIEKNVVVKEKNVKKKPSGITVDSDALLYSVTHSREDVRAYYAQYKIDRKKVLNLIEKELKKSSLTIDANTILAEVERDVNEESFQNNFYQFIKKRVSDVATAIANRNN